MIPAKFTYPFRYVPHPLVVEAARKLIAAIDSDPLLKYLFSEGKMLGVLVCSKPDSEETVTLNAFSGLAGGHSTLPGFVPPIFDTTTVPSLRRHLSAEGPVPSETCATLGTIRGGTASAVGPKRSETVLKGTCLTATQGAKANETTERKQPGAD